MTPEGWLQAAPPLHGLAGCDHRHLIYNSVAVTLGDEKGACAAFWSARHTPGCTRARGPIEKEITQPFIRQASIPLQGLWRRLRILARFPLIYWKLIVLPSQPHRVTSGLFTSWNLTQIEYNAKHEHHIYKSKTYQHNPKVSPLIKYCSRKTWQIKLGDAGTIDCFGLAFQDQIKNNYQKEWTKTVAN